MTTDVADQGTTFSITDTKLYVPVVTLSTQDNAKLLERLKAGFKRKINGNKYQSKKSIDKGYIRGHSKRMFDRSFLFLMPLPFVRPCSFYMYPLSTYVCFSELPTPSLKKSSTALMIFRMKKRGVKREKRNNFFVNLLYIQWQ